VAVGEFSDLYDSIIEAESVGLSTQTAFPSNEAFGARVLWKTGIRATETGATVRHSRTNAYSRYADANGRIYRDASVSTTLLMFTARTALLTGRDIRPYVQIQGGPALVENTLDYFTRVDQVTGSPLTRDFSLAGSRWGYAAEASLVTTYPLGPIYASFEAGYRVGSVSSLNVSTRLSSGETASVASDVDLSGWTLLLGVGYRM
jgi:hypothetical protein